MKVKNMTTFDRLKARESLKFTLVNEDSEIDSPDWHGNVLAERKAKIEDGEANFISLDALRAYRG